MFVANSLGACKLVATNRNRAHSNAIIQSPDIDFTDLNKHTPGIGSSFTESSSTLITNNFNSIDPTQARTTSANQGVTDTVHENTSASHDVANTMTEANSADTKTKTDMAQPTGTHGITEATSVHHETTGIRQDMVATYTSGKDVHYITSTSSVKLNTGISGDLSSNYTSDNQKTTDSYLIKSIDPLMYSVTFLLHGSVNVIFVQSHIRNDSRFVRADKSEVFCLSVTDSTKNIAFEALSEQAEIGNVTLHATSCIILGIGEYTSWF